VYGSCMYGMAGVAWNFFTYKSFGFSKSYFQKNI
jgi:hypothetical protein